MTKDASLIFILLHSPLVGPLTWKPVAGELRRQGWEAHTPALSDDPASGLPYWQQHTLSVAHALAALPAESPIVLVGHSGAGLLLPAFAEALRRPVAAYLFVDAGLPTPQVSRLEAMQAEAPQWAEELRQILQSGGRFPTWSEADLYVIIPDSRLRQELVSQIRPRELAFFTEPIPVYASWPDAPCAYLQFSAAYDQPANQARRQGWAFHALPAQHFHMLVDPPAVAEVLINLLHRVSSTP